VVTSKDSQLENLEMETRPSKCGSLQYIDTATDTAHTPHFLVTGGQK